MTHRVPDRQRDSFQVRGDRRLMDLRHECGRRRPIDQEKTVEGVLRQPFGQTMDRTQLLPNVLPRPFATTCARPDQLMTARPILTTIYRERDRLSSEFERHIRELDVDQKDIKELCEDPELKGVADRL